MKPSACVYTSLFAIEHILTVNPEAQDELNVIARDYCANLETSVSEKLDMVNKLISADTSDQGQYVERCNAFVGEDPANQWFDPLITSDVVTTSDLCEAFRELFTALKGQGYQSIEKATIYTYVLIFQMHMNSLEEQVFDRCVDKSLLDQTDAYCSSNLVPAL